MKSRNEKFKTRRLGYSYLIRHIPRVQIYLKRSSRKSFSSTRHDRQLDLKRKLSRDNIKFYEGRSGGTQCQSILDSIGNHHMPSLSSSASATTDDDNVVGDRKHKNTDEK